MQLPMYSMPQRKGCVPWNKGLSTPNHVRKKQSEAQKGKPGRVITDDERRRTSETIRAKVKAGTWHNSFARSRTHEYKGVRLYGLWEVAFAKHLDATGVEWRRPTENFPYIFENMEHRYTPDFYLPLTDEYIEVKGYPTAKDRAKWVQFPRKLRVIFGDELHQLGLIERPRKTRSE